MILVLSSAPRLTRPGNLVAERRQAPFDGFDDLAEAVKAVHALIRNELGDVESAGGHVRGRNGR